MPRAFDTFYTRACTQAPAHSARRARARRLSVDNRWKRRGTWPIHLSRATKNLVNSARAYVLRAYLLLSLSLFLTSSRQPLLLIRCGHTHTHTPVDPEYDFYITGSPTSRETTSEEPERASFTHLAEEINSINVDRVARQIATTCALARERNDLLFARAETKYLRDFISSSHARRVADADAASSRVPHGRTARNSPVYFYLVRNHRIDRRAERRNAAH